MGQLNTRYSKQDNTSNLRQALLSISNLDSRSLEVFLGQFEPIQMKKGTPFARKGEYAKKIAFVEAGVLRAYYQSQDGSQYNKTFFKENSLLGAYASLISGEKNLIDIECLTDCILWTSNYADITALYDEHPKIERFSRILAERFFISKERREIELVTLEAKDRYAIFLKEHPGLEQRIPQYHIASYLGVSPTQLSRIRAQK